MSLSSFLDELSEVHGTVAAVVVSVVVVVTAGVVVDDDNTGSVVVIDTRNEFGVSCSSGLFAGAQSD